MTHYKVLVDGQSVHGGNLTWSLPRQDESGNWLPGDWHEVKGDIVICENGLHLTTEPHRWMKWGAEIYVAEGDGDQDGGHGDKTAFRRARLLNKVDNPAWWTSAQEFVRGVSMLNWLKPDGSPNPEWKLFTAPTWAAAWDAARAAARDATEDAAEDASEDASGDAAWAAARVAAEDAARVATGDAAEDAAGDAAWAAAWDAAEDAAEDVTGAAARAAAEAAAWAAARAAGGDAALYVQIEHICADLLIDQSHRNHVQARWQVWQKGYALLCDVNGVLYVYAAESVTAP